MSWKKGRLRCKDKLYNLLSYISSRDIFRGIWILRLNWYKDHSCCSYKNHCPLEGHWAPSTRRMRQIMTHRAHMHQPQGKMWQTRVKWIWTNDKSIIGDSCGDATLLCLAFQTHKFRSVRLLHHQSPPSAPSELNPNGSKSKIWDLNPMIKCKLTHYAWSVRFLINQTQIKINQNTRNKTNESIFWVYFFFLSLAQIMTSINSQ